MRSLLVLLVVVVLLSLHAVVEAAPKKSPPKKPAVRKSPPKKSPPKKSPPKKSPPKKSPTKPKPRRPKAPPPLGKLSCKIGCPIRNRAIVPKTKPYQLKDAVTFTDCLRNAYKENFANKAGFQYFQWVSERGSCYAFKDCSYTKYNAAVSAGRMDKCIKLKWPPPPPPVPTYCSASFKGTCFRRCPRDTRCEGRKGGRNVCCCPPTQPNPTFFKGRLVGCQP